jgi:L-aspartate oxidase
MYDTIIIGAGIAGLNCAVNLKDKQVAIITKDMPWDCNTFYAQGGVAVATDEDDIASHIDDTINAGEHHNNIEAVKLLCTQGIKEIDKLVNDHFWFDKDANGNLLFTKEAAHSKNRILHAGGDATGRELHRYFMQKNPYEILYNTVVTDLLIEDDICYGVTIFTNGQFSNIYAKSVVIASGGIGSIYKDNTNSKTVSSDIHGMCVQKGITLQDMEMMQFHPTVFVDNRYARKQLLSEALRGEGAYIVDSKGKRFLLDFDSRAELSPRNIIAQAIYQKEHDEGEQVYLSFEAFEAKSFQKRFPSIYRSLKDLGYELPKDKVPIAPAFHYAMGGIKSDLDSRVSGFENLYVVGEAACNGVHGANRLASNSLLEGLVFSSIAAKNINQSKHLIKRKEFLVDSWPISLPSDVPLKAKLREIMQKKCGIVRTYAALMEAKIEILEMLNLKIGKLLHLRLLTAKAIVDAAIKRKSSLGAHFLRG